MLSLLCEFNAYNKNVKLNPKYLRCVYKFRCACLNIYPPLNPARNLEKVHYCIQLGLKLFLFPIEQKILYQVLNLLGEW